MACENEAVPDRWHPVKEALDEFHSYLAANVRFQIEVATRKEWVDDKEYDLHRPEGFPSNRRGVYLLFGSDQQLLYVGLATYNFDKRVWTHDDIDWRYLDIITFGEKLVFLAPALEYLLIRKLKPLRNKTWTD
jgi:hypothetical protein